MKIAAVIPARNEELLIGRAIQSLLQNGIKAGDLAGVGAVRGRANV
ncbi:MAG: hypothetical protein HZB99_00505 [Candidatus Harrisonbacteria bacterium]|nr:hypothetical protein [Candidatus Harrisonbacteria bacterium]